MATSQQFLVCDSSTLANFKQWAQAISAFFGTATWTQSADTGQVNWSTIASVPGSGAFVYEIWQPNDGLTTFYVKMEYGNVSGTNCPSLRITISSATNGSGTPTGFVMGPVGVNTNAFTAPSTTTQYECNFSGAAGRIGAMMWRNGTNNCQQAFCIERSLNASGVYTSAYVTLWTVGLCSSTAASQQSLLFGVGLSPAFLNTSTNLNSPVRLFTRVSSAFNGSIPIDLCAPLVGNWDYSCTVFGVGNGPDLVEGVPFTITLYSSTRTYMPSKNGQFGQPAPGSGVTGLAFCMRYD